MTGEDRALPASQDRATQASPQAPSGLGHLLTRNPAPDAAPPMCPSRVGRVTISAGGSACVHDGVSFAAHGRRCPGCGVLLVDFGD